MGTDILSIGRGITLIFFYLYMKSYYSNKHQIITPFATAMLSMVSNERIKHCIGYMICSY